MSAMASQITGVSIVCATVFYSGPDQRKHQSSALLAFEMWIHWRPVDSPHKGPVTRKIFPFDDVIMPLPLMPCHALPSHHQPWITMDTCLPRGLISTYCVISMSRNVEKCQLYFRVLNKYQHVKGLVIVTNPFEIRSFDHCRIQRIVSIKRCRLTSKGVPFIKIRRSNGLHYMHI